MNNSGIRTIAAGLALSLGVALGFVAPADAGVTVSIACGSVGAPNHILCVKAAKQWAAKTGNQVRFVTTPYSSTARLSLYEQWMAAHADIDVLMTDVYYPGILKKGLVDLTPYFKSEHHKFFPAYLKVDTIDGKQLAVPWFAAVGVMYYRKDLLAKYGLQPPKTWAELEKDAKLVQAKERAAGHPNFWGFVWQGKAYEGLTCDAVEWLASYGGGSIVSRAGKVTIDNPRAVAALTKGSVDRIILTRPAVEAGERLGFLPGDLREKALEVAAGVIELGGLASGTDALELARGVLEDGRAFRKVQAICEAQGAWREPGRAPYTHVIDARHDGVVSSIDNRLLARLAKLAGAPMASTAGVYLQVR
ncbi:MAG: extracellular solute-binding protein, partial [Acidihalobacter sp.]